MLGRRVRALRGHVWIQADDTGNGGDSGFRKRPRKQKEQRVGTWSPENHMSVDNLWSQANKALSVKQQFGESKNNCESGNNMDVAQN